MFNALEVEIDAVAFDLDGTLIDSMDDHADAWERVLSAEGYEFNKDLYLLSEGIPLRTLIPMTTNYQAADSVELTRLISQKDRLYEQSVKGSNLADCASELVKFFKDLGLPLALVTAGQRARVVKTLDKEILDQFDCVVCGDQLEFGKPYPHPYMFAADSLNVLPSEMLVVENAVCGAVSSYLAGTTLVYIGVQRVCLPNQVGRFSSLSEFHSKLKEH